MSADDQKRASGEAAAALVEDGMTLGLGTGSTAAWFVEAVASFSVITHFEGLQKGVVDSRDLVFYLSLIGFSLFSTSVILRGRRAG